MLFRYIGKRLTDAYKREPNISTEEWASKNVYFTGTDVSPITGAFQVKYSPHLKRLFALVDKPRVHKIFAKWASQSAKSLFELIVAGKRLDCEPTNILYMQPIKDDIPKIVDVKIDPLLKCMPKLWKKFEDYKVKESIRGKREMKRLAGGGLIISGSSVKERKSLTIPFLLMDEIAEFEQGAVVEAEERTKSFSKFFPKVIGVSTIIHPEDEICTNYNDCEAKMEWQFICPDCEHHFYPNFDLFKYPSKAEYAKEINVPIDEVVKKEYLDVSKARVHVECPHCSYKIDSVEKDHMILNGGMDWFFVEGDDTATSFGVDMNSLGSYFVPFEILVENLVKADGDEVKLEKIYRGWFNKFYEATKIKTSKSDILLLANNYDEWIVPEDTVAMYMGVDTQKDHFWVEIIAYTYGMVSHTVHASRVEEFKTIVELMERSYYKKDGSRYVQGIKRMGIDRQGYVEKVTEFNEETNQEESKIVVDRPQEVRDFVYEMSDMWGADEEYEKIYATRGHEFLPNDEPFSFTSINMAVHNYKDTRKIKGLKLGTIALKLSVLQSVHRNIQKHQSEESDEAFGYESRLHYVNKTTIEKISAYTKNDSTSYDNQYTSEVYGYNRKPNGKKNDYKSFIQVKKDNHYLDCGVICMSLAIMDNIASKKKPDKKKKKFSVARSMGS